MEGPTALTQYTRIVVRGLKTGKDGKSVFAADLKEVRRAISKVGAPKRKTYKKRSTRARVGTSKRGKSTKRAAAGRRRKVKKWKKRSSY